MARVEKGTRIRFLPPREQKKQLESLSGSYPTINRTVSDNRTGKYPVLFDDSKSVDFINSASLVAWSSGFLSGSQYLTSEIQTSVSGIFGNCVPANVEPFIPLQRTRVGQELTPFRDHDNNAINPGCFENSFYLTGSRIEDVGEGFHSPVFDKTKIEIDLSVNTFCSACFKSGTVASSPVDDFPVVYYNHSTRTYVGVGGGNTLESYSGLGSPMTGYVTDKAMIFSTSAEYVGLTWFYDEELKSNGTVVSNWGFPTHEKFLAAASGSFLYPLSGVLSEPFLVEKIVLNFSGALVSHQFPMDNMAISSFFILNKRRPAFISETYETEASSIPDSISISSVHSSGSLEMVTYLQISAYTDVLTDFQKSELSREYNVEVRTSFTLNTEVWGGRYVVSGTVKEPGKNNGITDALQVYYPGGINQYILSYPKGGRNGLSKPCGRNWLKQVGTFDAGEESPVIPWLNIPLSSSKINPYILFPSDELIFGWQPPLDALLCVDAIGGPPWTGAEGPSLIFPPASASLTLYGSLLRNNEEYHDTLGQFLITNDILETIG